MENREGKGKMEKERDWEEGCGWFGVQGWSPGVTRWLVAEVALVVSLWGN